MLKRRLNRKIKERILKKFRTFGILTVYNENKNVLPENEDEKFAYYTWTTELTHYINCKLTKTFYFAKLIEAVTEFNEGGDNITEKICLWCNNNEIDIIIITGYPYDWPHESAVNQMSKIIKKIINKEGFEKYDAIVSKIKNCDFAKKLQFDDKSDQFICGIRNETLIINLYGFRDEHTFITYFDAIITILEQNIEIELTSNQEEGDTNKAKCHIESSSFYDKPVEKTNDENEAQCYGKSSSDKCKEKVLSTLETTNEREKDDGQKVKYCKELPSSSIEKIDVANEDTICKKSSIVDIIQKKLNAFEQHVDKESFSSSDTTLKELMVTNEITVTSEASSSDKMKELNVAKQDIIDMKSSEDYSSSSDVISETELEDVIPKDIKYPLIPVEKALSIIQKVTRYGANEKKYDFVNLNDAYGRTLCETVYSDCNVPAFRVSAKHGYAVLASDGQGVRTEILLDETLSEPVSLKPGTCVWVKSGARVPDEATAVVQVKDVKPIVNNTKNLIMIKIKPEFGQNIKNIGSEIQKEQLIIHSFTRIGPAELGLLATIGRKKVIVAARISVGVLSIGDLLEEPENPLTPGYVYDSNRISLIALLKDKGFDMIEDFGIVADKTLLIKSKIEEALTKVDVLVTIGCSNDIDQLKMTLFYDFKASILFGNVNVKPGKSTMFATCKFDEKRKYFLCLSGNPVTTLISAHLFLLPLLNGLRRIYKSPPLVPTCINQRYILHSRPRIVWSVLRWNDNDNFARAFSKDANLGSDKQLSSQASNALLMLPPQTIDRKVMPPAFVSALPINF